MSSISAQSCDSVPPAPGWIDTMALELSYSPPSIFRTSAVSTSASSSFKLALEIGGDVLALAGPVHQHRQVVGPPPQRVAQRNVLLEAPAPLHHLLGLLLVAPEVGLPHRPLDFG